jgi:hypothetical protein
MYGYTSPKKPELGTLRVMICESEIRGYMKTYPDLDRAEILATMITAGPLRAEVDSALARRVETVRK